MRLASQLSLFRSSASIFHHDSEYYGWREYRLRRPGVWANPLRHVTTRLHPLFGQERVAAPAGQLPEGLLSTVAAITSPKPPVTSHGRYGFSPSRSAPRTSNGRHNSGARQQRSVHGRRAGDLAFMTGPARTLFTQAVPPVRSLAED